jgi:hypothetical protein
MGDHESTEKWDLFISYASEDRNEVAEPLATLLGACGLKVWYDQRELRVGDSLRRKIDEGLSRCHRGVVILSPSFFGKHYPNRELDGLVQRETDGETIILPIWYNVTDSEVRNYSPPLADRIAARWEDGPLAVTFRILEVVRPDFVEEAKRDLEIIQKNLIPLPELQSGSDLAQVLRGALAFSAGNDEPKNEEELDLVSGLQQYVQDWLDIVDDLDVGERVRMEYDLSRKVRDIQEAGWMLFGKQVLQRLRFGDQTDTWPVALIVIARQGTKQVFQIEGGKFLISREASV